MAFPGIVNVIIVNLLFNFICGIIGVNYFKGRLYTCSVNQNHLRDVLDMFATVDTKWECVNSGGEWKNSFLNFDDIYGAMKAFFIVSTGVSWSKIMF